MSKKLIAGAGVVAALAVALAPLATFAEVVDGNAHRDTIKATIDPRQRPVAASASANASIKLAPSKNPPV